MLLSEIAPQLFCNPDAGKRGFDTIAKENRPRRLWLFAISQARRIVLISSQGRLSDTYPPPASRVNANHLIALTSEFAELG